MLVQALGPSAQGDGVVLAEALNVGGAEAGALERKLDAREWKRLAVGKHVARGEQVLEWLRVRVERGDRVVQQRPSRSQQPEQRAGVQVDLLLPHVLGHADAGDRVEGARLE